MIQSLLHTDPNITYTFLRLIAGGIIFPYGMQKLLGWFKDFGGGVGIKASLAQFKEKSVPTIIAWGVIIGQSVGSIALLIGFASRIVAIINFIIFTGALVIHLPDGWSMNWAGTKKGEGIEYFIMLLAILFTVILNGSGGLSVDYWLFN